MRLKTQRRAIYAAMALTVVALTGGFTLASVQLGQSNSIQQGSQTTTVSQVTGVTWVSTTLVYSTGISSPTSCVSGSPCSVTSAGATDCAGGLVSTTCAAGDWIEQVNLTTVLNTAFVGNAGGTTNTLMVTLYVTTGSGTTVGTTFYYQQSSSTNSPKTILQDYDITSASGGPSLITSVSVVIQG